VPRLGPDVRLDLVADRPVLSYRSLPGLPDVPPLELHPLTAAVVAWLDAGRDAEAVVGHLAERLQHPAAPLREIVLDVSHIFSGHCKHGGASAFVAVGDPERLLDRLATPGARFRSREVVLTDDRAPFPLTVQWLVTRYCNRR
jgi:hypothetical protein